MKSELSDDELEAVVGGGRCICSFGGGGNAGEDEKTYACVMGGGGLCLLGQLMYPAADIGWCEVEKYP